jgi:hypothetical protein
MTGGPLSTDIARRGNTPASEDIGGRIKRALAEDLRESRLSRAQIAFDLSNLVGRAVSVATIDAWTAATKPHRIPIEMVPAWVGVTGSRRVLDLICGEAKFYVATEQDLALAEMGRIHLEREQADRRLEEIKEKLCRAR